MNLKRWIHYIPHAAWAMALIATMGSLYFSEVMHLPPCVLCWYQRIAMYPLVAILAVGILRKDKGVAVYALPPVLVGLGISIYHNLLYWKILPESVAPCTLGVSCTTKFFEWFGFITIPFLSLTAFVVLTALLITYHRLSKKYD
jgi:disulfide bond formation protein DsbB